MVQLGVFKTLHEALCVPWDINSCSCVLCQRVVPVSDKHVVTICGMRRATPRGKISPAVICLLSVAVPEDFCTFAAHLFVVCQICV